MVDFDKAADNQKGVPLIRTTSLNESVVGPSKDDTGYYNLFLPSKFSPTWFLRDFPYSLFYNRRGSIEKRFKTPCK
jgi:hypothetical protein